MKGKLEKGIKRVVRSEMIETGRECEKGKVERGMRRGGGGG